MEQLVLNNKSKLWIDSNKSDKSISIVVNCRVGSRDESGPLIGISHFVEHILFKGTTKYPTSKILTKKLDSLGAIFNAHTSYDHTQYYIKCVDSVALECAEILHQMIYHSLFVSEEMEKEKKVVIEELNKNYDNPMSVVWDDLYRITFNKHELGRDVGGTIDDVKKYKAEDVKKYYKQYYRPENMLIVLTGNITDGVKNNIIKLFGSEKVISTPKLIKPNNLFNSKQTNYNISVIEKDVDQYKLMIGIPLDFGILNIQKCAILEVINNILGGNMSSRLFMEIRENKGLCYTIRSSIDVFYETGIWYIFAGISKGNLKKALEGILEILKDIRNGKYTDAEIEESKVNLERKHAMGNETNLNIATFYASQGVYSDKPLYDLKQYIENINSVTKKDIQKLCSQLISTAKLNVSLVK